MQFVIKKFILKSLETGLILIIYFSIPIYYFQTIMVLILYVICMIDK